MAGFTEKVAEPNVNFLRPQRGVQDNSIGKAISGVGKSYLDYQKNSAIAEAKIDTEALQKSFLTDDAADVPSSDPVAVVTKYNEGGGDKQGSEELVKFGQDIARLRKASASSGDHKQYVARGKLLLKSQINKMPGLSQEFKAIAGGLLGTSGIGVQDKIQLQLDVKAQAKSDLNAMNKDAMSLGLRPNEVLTSQGQSKYIRRSSSRSKHFELNQSLQYDKLLKANKDFQAGGKPLTAHELLKQRFETAKWSLASEKDVRELRELRTGVDPKILLAQTRGSLVDISGKSRAAAEGVVMNTFRANGFDNINSPGAWESLDSDQKQALRTDIRASLDGVLKEMDGMGLYTTIKDQKERESYIRDVTFAHMSYLNMIEGKEKEGDMARAISMNSKAIEWNISQDPLGARLIAMANAGLPISPQLQAKFDAETLAGTNEFSKLMKDVFNPPKPNPTETDKVLKDMKMDEIGLSMDGEQAAHMIDWAVNQQKLAESDPTYLSDANNGWDNFTKVYSGKYNGKIQKAALDTLVRGINAPQYSEVWDKLQTAKPETQAVLRGTLGRHYSQLIRNFDREVQNILPLGLKQVQGKDVINLEVTSSGMLVVQVGDAYKNDQAFHRKVSQLQRSKTFGQLTETMRAIKKFGGDEGTFLKNSLKGTSWDTGEDKEKSFEEDLNNFIETSSVETGVPSKIINKQIGQESSFDQSATSETGVKGLIQMTTATAEGLGLDPKRVRSDKREDAEYQMQAYSKYMKQLMEEFDGDVQLALLAYNSGPSSARKWRDEGVAPRKQGSDYVKKITGKTLTRKDS